MERRCLVVLLALFLAAAGCNRTLYRDNVDREVNDILREKDQFPAWKIDHFHVYPDPRARFSDQGRPDRPPAPPDDPATAEVSPMPQKPPHAGVTSMEGGGYLELLNTWDAENRAALKDDPVKKVAYVPGGLPPVVGKSPYPDPLTSKTPS